MDWISPLPSAGVTLANQDVSPRLLRPFALVLYQRCARPPVNENRVAEFANDLLCGWLEADPGLQGHGAQIGCQAPAHRL